jgi:hypothetical protein
MHRKRETPTPASSASSIGNAEVAASARAKSAADDDALLALEQQFEILAREFSMLLKTSATQDGKGKRRNGRDAARAERSGELTLASDGANSLAPEQLEELEAALARLAPVEQAIMATPAQTVLGLGVKARHAAYVVSEYWAEPLEKADWDRPAVRLLIEAVCLVAGRPLAASEPSEQWLRG